MDPRDHMATEARPEGGIGTPREMIGRGETILAEGWAISEQWRGVIRRTSRQASTSVPVPIRERENEAVRDTHASPAGTNLAGAILRGTGVTGIATRDLVKAKVADMKGHGAPKATTMAERGDPATMEQT